MKKGLIDKSKLETSGFLIVICFDANGKVINKKSIVIVRSPITKKNGLKGSKLLYKCHACGKQFIGGKRLESYQIWEEHQQGNKPYCN